MYKKILTFLFSLCLIALGVQGYFLLQAINDNKTKNQQQDLYAQQINQLTANLATYEEKIKNFNQQLYDKNAKIEQAPLATAIVNKVSQATVNINTTILESAYQHTTERHRKGIIIDKNKGLILTTAYAVGRAAIASHEVITHHGSSLQATLIYCDSWVDVAVLQVDPKQLTDQQEITLSTQPPTLNQPIFLLGNSQGNRHSVHTGRISKIAGIVTINEDDITALPTSATTYSINSQGNLFGSGVYNYQGHLLGLHFAGGKTFGHSITHNFLKHIITAIKNNKTPSRKHIGIHTTAIPLADIIKYADLSKEDIHNLKNDLPDHVKELIVITNTIKGTPAETTLKPGDIIYKANEQRLGSDLTKLDLLMSTTQDKHITLTLFRRGQKIQQQVKLYDITQHNITKMVAFAGTVFFQVDQKWADLLHVPMGTLTFHNIKKGSTLNTSPYFYCKQFWGQVHTLDGKKITNLDDLIQHIPQLIKKGYFTMSYTDIYKRDLATLINYNPLDPPPMIYTYNHTDKDWYTKTIQQ